MILDILKNVYNFKDSAAAKNYISSFFDKSTREGQSLNDNERAALADIVRNQLGRGSNTLSYSNYNEEGGKKIGYGRSSVPNLNDPRESLKHLLGKANIIRDGDTVLVGDTYDFGGDLANKHKDSNFFDKLKDGYSVLTSGDTGLYGKAHQIQEIFGAREGNGIPVRIPVGTAQQLGISPEQLAALETRQEYDKRVGQMTAPSKGAASLLSNVIANQAPAPSVPIFNEQAMTKPETYTIKRGDTLSKISKQTGISISELASMNDIEDVNKIKAGQSIVLSVPQQQASPIRLFASN